MDHKMFKNLKSKFEMKNSYVKVYNFERHIVFPYHMKMRKSNHENYNKCVIFNTINFYYLSIF